MSREKGSLENSRLVCLHGSPWIRAMVKTGLVHAVPTRQTRRCEPQWRWTDVGDGREKKKPRKSFISLRCTYIIITQYTHTHGVVIPRRRYDTYTSHASRYIIIRRAFVDAETPLYGSRSIRFIPALIVLSLLFL